MYEYYACPCPIYAHTCGVGHVCCLQRCDNASRIQRRRQSRPPPRTVHASAKLASVAIHPTTIPPPVLTRTNALLPKETAVPRGLPHARRPPTDFTSPPTREYGRLSLSLSLSLVKLCWSVGWLVAVVRLVTVTCMGCSVTDAPSLSCPVGSTAPAQPGFTAEVRKPNARLASRVASRSI